MRITGIERSGPIAVIDSGLGGLTVARALRRILPGEDLIYFGDTAHLPYGNKSPETVYRFVRRIVEFLAPRRPRHVVFGCNTATAVALARITGEFPDISFSGVIEPGARAAVKAAGAKRLPIIGVIGTEATVRSKAYERAILRRRNLAQVVQRPTPLLVAMIEEGRTHDDPLVDLALRQYLQGMILRRVDVLVLGCTHYPLLKPAIALVMGKNVQLIDSAEQCALDVARRLGKQDGIAPGERSESKGRGGIETFVTDDPIRFGALASRFLGVTLANPTLVNFDIPPAAAGVGEDGAFDRNIAGAAVLRAAV